LRYAASRVARAGQSARYLEENIGTRDIGECPYYRADLGVRAIRTKYDGGGLLVDDDDDDATRGGSSSGVLRERETRMSLDGIYARVPLCKDHDHRSLTFSLMSIAL